MELVFDPDLEHGEEAAALIKELIIILQRLGTCSCKMEGELSRQPFISKYLRREFTLKPKPGSQALYY